MRSSELLITRRKLKLALLITALSVGWLCFYWSASSLRAAQAPQSGPNPPINNSHYVGNHACVQCHQQKAASHAASAMWHALRPANEAPILRAHSQISFRHDRWNYQITRAGDRVTYTVTDGKETFTAPIVWAFGRGVSGQTYVIQRDGAYYETRVSFFTKLKALDFTPGAPRQVAASLNDAIGQRLSQPDAQSCFGCHATVAPGAARFQLDQFTPGIGCEACHGPGEKHVALMKTPERVTTLDKQIFNPRRMHPDEMSQQFCGACHRSWETVMGMPERGGGLSNVRFQPYRLANSKCYQNPDDRRISCTACHDPHQDPRHDAAFYDAKCLACHQTKPHVQSVSAKDRTAPPCPTAQANCASCHMPKIEPPGLHFKFTDHHIRTVKPGEPYPN
jgi:hypothetical protein